MSDKEIDKLFQERFEDFAVDPSQSFWPSIKDRLENKKVKREFPLFWIAAASVVLVFAAGLYLLRPDNTIRLYNNDTLQVISGAQPAVPEVPKEQLSARQEAVQQKPFRKPVVQSIKKSEAGEVKSIELTTGPEAAQVVKLARASSKIETHEDHALSRQPVITIPDENQEQTIASVASDSTFRRTAIAAGRPRIKSVGDLVNFVVAQVDQREDKIIEMIENDEGTSISGINLGVLKIKTVTKKEPSGFKMNFK